MSPRSAPTLLPAPSLLISESAEEFGRLRRDFRRDTAPDGVIEDFVVDDIAYFTWEIIRWRRCKAALINAAYPAALENLFRQLLAERGEDDEDDVDVEQAAAEFARDWFADCDLRERLARALGERKLDESAIEAEALQIARDDVEAFDRMLASVERRRDRTLRTLYEYRAEFAEWLRASSDRIIDGEVLPLDGNAHPGPSAAA